MKNLLSNSLTIRRRSATLLALLGLWLGNLAGAQTATFDLDTATPTLTPGQTVPFDQTAGAVTAHFSASSGGFSVQNYNTTFLILPRFSGNYLFPNSGDPGVLVIQFSQQITNLVMDFATAEATPNENRTPIQLTAYTNSTSTPPVGTLVQVGNFGTNGIPMGTLTFNSATPFNLVTLMLTTNLATGFLVDNLVVKVSGGTNFTIATSASPPNGGTTTGAATYLSGAPVTVLAEAHPGYAFVNWTENGIEVSTLANYGFTATAFRTLVANFVPTYDIATSASPLAGGTTSGDGTYPAGVGVNVKATATLGNVFVNWTEAGVSVSTWADYHFTVHTNRTLVANFAAAFTITTSSAATDAGFTLGDGEYASGASVTVVATPNTGYRFVDWTQNDVPVSTSASYSFNAGTNRVLVGNFTVDSTSFTFDFDSGAPPLSIGQTTPFEQASGTLTASFSGTNDPAFAVTSDFISGWVLSKFSNNYLAPNVLAGVLDIRFSQPVTSLTLTFATLDFQDVVAPTPLRLTAYTNSTGTPAVGTITATGTYSGNNSMPMGTLSFASATPFNLVRLTLPPTLLEATEFMVDNLNVVIANAPPLPTNPVLATVRNKPVSFSVTKLATDPDGDPLTFAVSSASSSGGTVTRLTDVVTYTPPTDYTGSDTFTYTVSDGHNAAANGTVTVPVSAGIAVSLNFIYAGISNGSFVVRFAGVPGYTYTLESSADLTSWHKVINLDAPTSDQGWGVGVCQFTEPTSGATIRYYRTVYPHY